MVAPPAKRRKTEPKVEEITFDLSARQEYLTGFHKRKLQRAKFAQEKAEERARLERIEERKKIREERKADLDRHVQAINDLLRPPKKSGDEVESEDGDQDVTVESWEGIEDQDPEPVDHEAEYIDEGRYTTVTVEVMDVTKEGLSRAEDSDNDVERDGEDTKSDMKDAEESSEAKSKGTRIKSGKRPWVKDKPNDKPRKPKKKRNFRYEGKLDRKANRVKQKRKNSEQAKARKTG